MSKLRVAADVASDFLYQDFARYSTMSCTVEIFARRLSLLWLMVWGRKVEWESKVTPRNLDLGFVSMTV